MPHYRVEFDDGSTHEGEYANPDLAKRAAKTQAQQKSGAVSRTDPAVKVKAITDLASEDEAADRTARLEETRRPKGGR